MARPMLLLAVLVATSGWAGAAQAACSSLVPPAATASTGSKRPITARDLIEIRDIGDAQSSSFGMPSRLAVSPDGTRVAYSLVRADLADNGYCLAIAVAPIAPSAAPLLVDAGGKPLPAVDILRGYYVDSGAFAPVIPAWSPDGRMVAFLRRDSGITQLWVAATDGSGSRTVTRSSTDIADFMWNRDGQRLVYASRPGMAAVRAATLREGRGGWLYDQRIVPAIGAAPLIAAATPRTLLAVEIDGGNVRPASASETAGFPAEQIPGVAAPPAALSIDGRQAVTERQGTSLLAPLALAIVDAAGRRTPCNDDWCRGGITGLWWTPDGAALYVMRRQGWNNEETALYRWVPGTRPRTVFISLDDIQDCAMAGVSLLCTRENAVTPRRIVAFNLRNGRSREIFDPNPEFAGMALGQVRRLKARNSLGLESWADLVLPPDYRPGMKLPLIIVQYRSNGFLRGGTGDEYPIHLLAAHGFAVLSFERPPFVAAAYPNAKSAFEINAIILKDWAERRSTLSSLLAELDLAVASGSIDPARIGITGQSDGASTVQFALISSKRFAAAAISSCCFEPRSVTTYAGTAFSDYVRKMGFPGATADDRAFWKANSLAVSGGDTETPLLMQLADSEYLNALEAFEALREYRKPVELHIFPEEFHVKRQPEHRLAVYDRNLDWFAFWLQGKTDPDPAKQAQYVRWRNMRMLLTERARP